MPQIFTTAKDNHARATVEYQREAYVSLGIQRGVVELLEGGIVASSFSFESDKSEWMTLDRDSINNLIRSLREARDKAFGRDE